MSSNLTYWANHNDLTGDHHGWCTYYIASIFGKICFFPYWFRFWNEGVISSVIFNMDGTVEFSLGWDEFYSFIEVRNLKIVGDVHLRWFPLIYEISGNPWYACVSGIFYWLNITYIIFSSCLCFGATGTSPESDWSKGNFLSKDIHRVLCAL